MAVTAIFKDIFNLGTGSPEVNSKFAIYTGNLLDNKTLDGFIVGMVSDDSTTGTTNSLDSGELIPIPESLYSRMDSSHAESCNFRSVIGFSFLKQIKASRDILEYYAGTGTADAASLSNFLVSEVNQISIHLRTSTSSGGIDRTANSKDNVAGAEVNGISSNTVKLIEAKITQLESTLQSLQQHLTKEPSNDEKINFFRNLIKYRKAEKAFLEA